MEINSSTSTDLREFFLLVPTNASFFNSVGLASLSFTYTTMITAIGIVFSILAICVVDFTGRRPLLLAGIALAAIFNAVLGGVGSKPNVGSGDIGTIVASLVMVSVGNKIGVNPLSCKSCCRESLLTIRADCRRDWRGANAQEA